MIVAKIQNKYLSNIVTIYNNASRCAVNLSDNITLINNKDKLSDALEDVCGNTDESLLLLSDNKDIECFALYIPHKAILICELDIEKKCFVVKLLKVQEYQEKIIQYILKYILLSCLIYCLKDIGFDTILIRTDYVEYNTCSALDDNDFKRINEYQWKYVREDY